MKHNLWEPLSKGASDRTSPNWKPTYNISKAKSGIYSLDYYDKDGKRIRLSLSTRNKRDAISKRKLYVDSL